MSNVKSSGKSKPFILNHITYYFVGSILCFTLALSPWRRARKVKVGLSPSLKKICTSIQSLTVLKLKIDCNEIVYMPMWVFYNPMELQEVVQKYSILILSSFFLIKQFLLYYKSIIFQERIGLPRVCFPIAHAEWL